MALILACNHENMMIKSMAENTKEHHEDPYKQVQTKTKFKTNISEIAGEAKFKYRETMIDC